MDLSYANDTMIPRSPIELLQGAAMHITLYKNGATWQIKDHTAATPAFVNLTDQTVYQIPKNMQFRGLCPDGSSDTYVIHYTKMFRGILFSDILETFVANQIKTVWPYQILLDASTTATLIHIHG
jgi:hypothetical protein